MTDILQEIIAHKRIELASSMKAVPEAMLLERIAKAPPPRDFAAALVSEDGRPRVIAECKRQSPSRGVMVPNYDPVALATAYENGGAAAISVLTDERFFGGNLADLRAVRARVGLPVLRKDFIVDRYQVYEARAHGADSFLLLAGVLSSDTLEELIQQGRSLGMEPLVESHTLDELRVALRTSARVVGINNRDLKTFSVSLEVARSLVAETQKKAPAPLPVCESGIHARADIERMQAVGFPAFLIGEALVTAPDPAALLRELGCR